MWFQIEILLMNVDMVVLLASSRGMRGWLGLWPASVSQEEDNGVCDNGESEGDVTACMDCDSGIILM